MNIIAHKNSSNALDIHHGVDTHFYFECQKGFPQSTAYITLLCDYKGFRIFEGLFKTFFTISTEDYIQAKLHAELAYLDRNICFT